MKKYLFYYVWLFLGLMSFIACSDDDKKEIIDEPDEKEEELIIIEDSKPSGPIAAGGFYVVNEDWFGHDNGTVNYFKQDGSVVYRAYRMINTDEQLGATTQFATIYGENAYFVSKQGNRFVVADAKTFKKKAVLTDIGGDGRSFVGVTPYKGYIATGKGISIFNIETLSVEGSIDEINGQTGNMCLAGKYVFAVVQSKGVYIINAETNKVEEIIEGTAFATLTKSKDGNVWIANGTQLLNINPSTLEISEVDIADVSISGSWGAWNAGSLCASTQQNVLYWIKGTSVVKYDIDNNDLTASLYSLGTDEAGLQLAFYGAGLRVDPLTDKLVLTVIRRFGYQYNWLYILNNDGTVDQIIQVKDNNELANEPGPAEDLYYWFPAMPFFEDANEPEILINQIILEPGERKAIYLNEKVIDADNSSSSIIKTISDYENNLAGIELKGDSLIVTALNELGTIKLKIHANSNGKLVEKEVRIDIRE